jgi:hypothetical protein
MRTFARNTVQLAIAACIAMAGGAAIADQGCSVATLSGAYVFTASGFGAPAGSWAPKAILEMIQMNGDGTLASPGGTIANRAGDGQVVTSATLSPGTYTLTDACTGTLHFNDGPSFNIMASPKGDTFWMIQTNPNNVFQGIVTRISR